MHSLIKQTRSSLRQRAETIFYQVSPCLDTILASQQAKTICRVEVHGEWGYGRGGPYRPAPVPRGLLDQSQCSADMATWNWSQTAEKD